MIIGQCSSSSYEPDMVNAEYSQQAALIDSPMTRNNSLNQVREFQFITRRQRRAVRSQRSIEIAILEACRTPTVQHWIMVKARLGYDTFWKHMNSLTSNGMIITSNDGYKTLYSVNQRGLVLLEELETTQH